MNIQLSTEVSVSKHNGICTVTMQKPPVNVLNIDFMRTLDKVITDPSTTAGVSILVLKAEGKAFCAGVDVADHTPERTEEMLSVFHGLITHLKELPLPTVALVEGAALGGGFELVLACDMVLASEKSKFAVPEITLAVFPPVALLELPPLIGIKKTAELILSGRTITAAEAEKLGIINEVYAVDEFAEKSAQFLSRFTKLSASSLRITKKALLNNSQFARDAQALKQVESIYMNELMQTPDAKEGIAAFLEKREPVWSNPKF